MEQRLRRLEAVAGAGRLRELVAAVAEEYELDTGEVLAEAERMLAEVRAGRSLADLMAETAALTGRDVAELEADAASLLARYGRGPGP